jgi:hypothetical protein
MKRLCVASELRTTTNSGPANSAAGRTTSDGKGCVCSDRGCGQAAAMRCNHSARIDPNYIIWKERKDEVRMTKTKTFSDFIVAFTPIAQHMLDVPGFETSDLMFFSLPFRMRKFVF